MSASALSLVIRADLSLYATDRQLVVEVDQRLSALAVFLQQLDHLSGALWERTAVYFTQKAS